MRWRFVCAGNFLECGGLAAAFELNPTPPLAATRLHLKPDVKRDGAQRPKLERNRSVSNLRH